MSTQTTALLNQDQVMVESKIRGYVQLGDLNRWANPQACTYKQKYTAVKDKYGKPQRKVHIKINDDYWKYANNRMPEDYLQIGPKLLIEAQKQVETIDRIKKEFYAEGIDYIKVDPTKIIERVNHHLPERYKILTEERRVWHKSKILGGRKIIYKYPLYEAKINHAIKGILEHKIAQHRIQQEDKNCAEWIIKYIKIMEESQSASAITFEESVNNLMKIALETLGGNQ